MSVASTGFAKRARYYWYCCNCNDGPFSMDLYAACMNCADHVRCSRCHVEGGSTPLNSVTVTPRNHKTSRHEKRRLSSEKATTPQQIFSDTSNNTFTAETQREPVPSFPNFKYEGYGEQHLGSRKVKPSQSIYSRVKNKIFEKRRARDARSIQKASDSGEPSAALVGKNIEESPNRPYFDASKTDEIPPTNIHAIDQAHETGAEACQDVNEDTWRSSFKKTIEESSLGQFSVSEVIEQARSLTRDSSRNTIKRDSSRNTSKRDSSRSTINIDSSHNAIKSDFSRSRPSSWVSTGYDTVFNFISGPLKSKDSSPLYSQETFHWRCVSYPVLQKPYSQC